MNDNNQTINPEEFKKVTAQMYEQNLELFRLNKKIENQNTKIETQKKTLEVFQNEEWKTAGIE